MLSCGPLAFVDCICKSNLRFIEPPCLQVRSTIQRALGRPLPLEEISTLTIGGVKALADKATLTTGLQGPQTIPAEDSKQEKQAEQILDDAQAQLGKPPAPLPDASRVNFIC